MRDMNSIQTRLPLGDLTPVEAWLIGLGLRAVEVASCPVPGCEVCAATRKPAPKAA